MNTVPAASSPPATCPPTICPCGPASETAKVEGEADGRVAWRRKVADMERMSKRPWKVTVPTGATEGWRRVTLPTVPEPLRTQRLVFFLWLNRARASTTSFPPGISKMKGLMEGSGSRVIIRGGLGLFLEPGGRPLGLRTTSIVAPSPVETGFWAARLGPPLLRLSSSSDV
ncbi:hypothetical protein VIGAN_03152900 [Vigna angularis var. angularis]|uniref:Uncharacterized protein n=1 Tax=Vigna angularis var. angularis TaxID=157739 RepID=A0A0S3RMB9_PHAAN|nr:hypothetical protein VIGAN_03152900 [Vigna angularis var. angularis]